MHIPESVFLDKSVIVVAHPDDEILWFSSIIRKVDAVIICFLASKYSPKWTKGRKKSLAEYPLSNIIQLNIDESLAFNAADWKNPQITNYGMKVKTLRTTRNEYEENVNILNTKLTKRLAGYKNVFTHNPWGEYGAEEHVQVYRAIHSLKEKIGFNLWFSNYCSNKSIWLFNQYVPSINSKYITIKTNVKIFNEIKALYQSNKCWSWYDDWTCFENESFLRDDPMCGKNITFGHLFPINMIRVEPFYLEQKRGNNKDNNIMNRILLRLRLIKY